MQQRGRLHYLLLPVAALIPILPLRLYGCSCGHDFDFHLLNWLEAARQFTQGTLYPHWAYTAAYNAGEPRFIFYPPLSWTIGAILGLLMPWTWTPIVYTWLILTAAGFSLHRLARSFASPTASLLAAIVYLTNPYTLFTAYQRTAYAELLAAVWIPLLLQAILEERVTIPRIALPVALLWLSNAPAAVMSCYALALLAATRLVLAKQNRLGLALTTAAGAALGLGLAAVYMVPAASERRYVQIKMAVLEGLRIQDNFLFRHTTAADHDQVLHTASLIALVLLTFSTIVLLILRYQASRAPEPGDPSFAASRKGWGLVHGGTALLLPLTTLTITIAFLLTPISTPIWLHAPELAFLQFPWRLLAILSAILSLTLALTLRTTHLKPATTTAIALTLAATLTYPAYTAFHQPCDPEDTVPARVALFHSNLGTEPTDEYTPTTADNDALTHTNPPYWLSPNPTAPPPTNAQPGRAPAHLTLNSPTPQTLILNLRDYPAWQITLNQTRVTTPIDDGPRRDDGLIAIPLPPGPSQIEIAYVQLPDQTIGGTITVLSLAAFAIVALRSRKVRQRTLQPTTGLPSRPDASER